MSIGSVIRAVVAAAISIAAFTATSLAGEGACCKPDGTCVVVQPGTCQVYGGYYLGDGTTCDPSPCDIPYGACCFIDHCIDALEPHCAELGGQFMGHGTRCQFNPCPPPTGACCTSGSCDIRVHTDCQGVESYYLGDYTECEPGACDPPVGCGEAAPRGERIDATSELGAGHGVLIDRGDSGCGTLLFTADETYENGYSWDYGGVRPPFFGAFAECYSGEGAVCSAVFDFTQVGGQIHQTMDVYVWDDVDGCPGNVLCVKRDIEPGPIAFWPEVSRHEVPLDGCCVPSSWWIGFWPNWPGQGINGWFITADLNGPNQGCKKTCIVPGIGNSAGWQDAETIFGPSQALGIGARVTSCSPVAVESQTWGRVKQLYR